MTGTERQVTAETKAFYRVELTDDKGECGHCRQACEMWTIVFESDGEPTEVGQSWGDKEMAHDVCDLMNMAFDAGLEHEHQYAKESAAPLGYVCACGENPPVGWYPESPDV
jgi:hypothetical protein